MPRLSDLVEVLGPSVARSLGRDVDGQVTSLVIYDEFSDLTPSKTGLLLAVGLRPVGERWRRLLEVAGDFGCVAVKPYGRADHKILPDPDGPAVVPVLVLADEVTWDQLIGLLSSAMTYTRPGQGPMGGRLGDLFSLANAVAATVGGATAIVDPARRLLAYSTVGGQRVDDTRRQSILDLQVPSAPEITSDYQAVHRAAGVIALPATGSDLPRLAAPVRAGGELLGSIWAIDPGGENRELARQRLGEAAGIAALHLLRERNERDGRQRRRGDLLAELLRGDRRSAVGALAPATSAVRVVALAPVEVAAGDGPSPATFQILELVTLHCHGESGFSAATVIDETVYLLLTMAPGLDRSRQQKLLAGLDAHVRRAYRYRLRIGVGHEGPALTATASSRRSADRVIQLMKLPSRTRPSTRPDVVFSEDVRAEVSLLRIAQACPVPDEATSESIAAITAYDQANGSEYLPTLTAYLRNSGDNEATARALHVHVNTCRYRVKRLKELFDLNLADPDSRLILTLQLRLSQFGA